MVLLLFSLRSFLDDLSNILGRNFTLSPRAIYELMSNTIACIAFPIVSPKKAVNKPLIISPAMPASEKPQKAIVVAVGKGTKEHSMTVKVGDTVLYGKYSGTELKFEGKDYLIMSEKDILAIV